MTAELRARIRATNRARGRRIAVLDDDPTGSQTVHDVDVVLTLEPEQYERALAEPGATCFVLTNSRSLAERDAVAVTLRAGRQFFELQQRLGLGGPVCVVSRSDSTLRGHLLGEVEALRTARREVLGAGHDGVLLVPAFLEAGRYTSDDVHWARVHGRAVPVGETEFARDRAFGYTASDLRDFVVERSGGAIERAAVHSITLDDIRAGGPDRVAQLLADVEGGRFVVVNATSYDDLEVVALGLLEAEASGRHLLPRCGPSFVRALAGLDPPPPLTAARLWPGGLPDGRGPGHGLVVVGSHVGPTTRQVETARHRGGLVEVVLDVPTLLDPQQRPPAVEQAADRVRTALADADVLLITSRRVITGPDEDGGLAISRAVSAAVGDVVRASLHAAPAWMIAKGGITSHDVAVAGLGIRRATVVGQLLPGLVSVWRPVQAEPAALGMPYVVFAGNVGDDRTLADAIDLFRTIQGRDQGRLPGTLP